MYHVIVEVVIEVLDIINLDFQVVKLIRNIIHKLLSVNVHVLTHEFADEFLTLIESIIPGNSGEMLLPKIMKR